MDRYASQPGQCQGQSKRGRIGNLNIGGTQAPPMTTLPKPAAVAAGPRPCAEAATSVEKLALPRHSLGYNHVSFEESAMLELVANIGDDVYAADKWKRGSASAPGTGIKQTNKQ